MIHPRSALLTHKAVHAIEDITGIVSDTICGSGLNRVAKQGGRFTISDIVSVKPYRSTGARCRTVGRLPVRRHVVKGLLFGHLEAGFLGIHLIHFSPWQVVDGVHFFSVTLTGYKLALINDVLFCDMPLSAAPLLAWSANPACRISGAFCNQILGSCAASEPRQTGWTAVVSRTGPLPWQGDFAVLAGPFLETKNDDHHLYRRGEPIEICSKTWRLTCTGYAPTSPSWIAPGIRRQARR